MAEGAQWAERRRWKLQSHGSFQIVIQSPFSNIPSRLMMVKPTTHFRSLKLAFFSPSLHSENLDSIFFSINGKPMKDSATLLNSGVLPFSTLTLHNKVIGGGGDGGATGAESRDCYLHMYSEKKPDKVDPNETRISKWTTCALSFHPLSPPCVLDKLGNIFNKQSLVEALIYKRLPKEFGHIRGLKDMIPIHLTVIPGKNSVDEISSETRFQCPITGLEFNGKYKFLALKGCGHVLSAKALKEVKSSACLVCHRDFSDSDKVVINGDSDEVAELRAKMEQERGKVREKQERRTKCEADEKVEARREILNGRNGCFGDDVKEKGVKRFRATDLAPTNATKDVYASIFTSSKKSDFKETFTCRSLPLGRN